MQAKHSLAVPIIQSATELGRLPATHRNRPKLFDAYERDGKYFGTVMVVRLGRRIYEFGLEKSEYNALRRVLSSRPFETTAACGNYHYYVAGGLRIDADDYAKCEFKIHTVQGRENKSFWHKGPTSLGKTLMWFVNLKDYQSAAHLRVTFPDSVRSRGQF